MNFIVDTNADASLLHRDTLVNNKTVFSEYGEVRKPKKSKNSIDDFAKLMGWGIEEMPVDDDNQDEPSTKRPNVVNTKLLLEDLDLKTGKLRANAVSNETLVNEAMKSSVLSDIDESRTLEKYGLSDKNIKKLNKIEREKTKGTKWFNLPAPEVTEEIKNDLEVLQMRSALDPKRFYKKNDLKVLPKYFQVGNYIDTPLDHYSNRGMKKNKQKTLVEELLADSEFQKYNKRKYKEIIESKKKTGYFKANKKMKKLKKKK